MKFKNLKGDQTKMYDDYYDDYNEFEEQIEKFKLSLIKGIKEEHQHEMERLKKENKELQEIKNNWNKLEREYKNKIRQVELEKEDFIKNVRREMYQDKLKEFLEKAFDEARKLYEVTNVSLRKDKCDICDSDRNVIVKDALGREYKVGCKCKENDFVYMAKETKTKLYIQKTSGKNDFWVGLSVDKEDRYSETTLFGFGDYKENANSSIYDKFDITNPPKASYYAYFTSKEEAEKYAEYLNEKRRKERKNENIY